MRTEPVTLTTQQALATVKATMAFQFKKLDIPNIVHIQPDVFGDDRGFFAEVFKQSAFAEAGITETFVQFNHSRSAKHVLRGLHYQKPPHAQAKLLMVTAGEIFDAVVDIRRSSPTFGQCVSATLSAEKKNMLWVPEGFAHALCVTSKTADVLYFVNREYAPTAERGIMWSDPALGITWPTDQPVLSDKDKVYPVLAEADPEDLFE